jgi:hypothetical protein
LSRMASSELSDVKTTPVGRKCDLTTGSPECSVQASLHTSCLAVQRMPCRARESVRRGLPTWTLRQSQILRFYQCSEASEEIIAKLLCGAAIGGGVPGDRLRHRQQVFHPVPYLPEKHVLCHRADSYRLRR